MPLPTILIIEDEAALRRFLAPTLGDHGYQVIQATTAAEGLSLARSHNPDLVLLDLGLPDRDGLQVLEELRVWTRRPILIVSARNQERVKVKALDLGADDYLTKPFGASELLARIRVALRHSAQGLRSDPVFDRGGLRVDLEKREVRLHGATVHLTVLQYKLLEALVQRSGKVATHTQLLGEVWGPGGAGQTHYLHIYMAQLRNKLEADPTRPRIFLTEPGVGYRMNTEDG